MQRAEDKSDFTKGSVPAVILRMALPLIAAQLVNIAYNLVDRIYIGHIPVIGTTALTGLGVAMPVIALVTAFANLCGVGGASLCALARGKGDRDEAERAMGNALLMLLVLGLALTLLCSLFKRGMLHAFGASEDTYGYAAEYFGVYVLGSLFAMVSLGMNGFINAQGFPRMGMLTVLLGAVANILLDPLFIFVFGLGVRGAAIATVIAQAISALWVLSFLRGRRAILTLDRRAMRPDLRLMLRVCALGCTGFIISFSNLLVQAVANRKLLEYGGPLYIGVMTAIYSLRDAATMVVHGLTSGAQPVMGYNYGAGAHARVRACIRFLSLCGVVYSLLIWLLIMCMPRALMAIFNDDPALLAAGESAIRVYYCGFAFMALQFTGQSVFIALGRAKQAVFFSLLRKVFIVVPLMLLLPGLGLGVDGVFWAEPISDLLGGAACYSAMLLTVYRRLDRADRLPDGEEPAECL